MQNFLRIRHRNQIEIVKPKRTKYEDKISESAQIIRYTYISHLVIFFSQLRASVPCGLFASSIHINILDTFLKYTMRATYSDHLILLYLIIKIIFSE
jgi:hypothetical protein